MPKCEHQIKLTAEEERLLNEEMYKVLCGGLDIVRQRSPNINNLPDRPPEDHPPIKITGT